MSWYHTRDVDTDGITSATTAYENSARANPFAFTLETADVRDSEHPVLQLPNVAAHASVGS